MTVLLVEDDPLIRASLAAALVEHGLPVEEAADGGEATALLEARPGGYSALVTDYELPGELHGMQIAARARALNGSIPVLMVSGHPDALRASWQAELGYVLLRKPCSGEALVALLAVALDG